MYKCLNNFPPQPASIANSPQSNLDFLSRVPLRSEIDSRQEIFPYLFIGHELVTTSNIHLTLLDHHRVREVRRITAVDAAVSRVVNDCN